MKKFKNDKMALAIKNRLSNRKKISSIQNIDFMHRKAILNHSVLTNKLYKLFCSNEISVPYIDVILSEFYHGSINGFITQVLPQSIKMKSQIWKFYIKNILEEESRPRLHTLLFRDFLKKFHFNFYPPGNVSDEFVALSKNGYSNDLCYSCGYALAVEVEADYQIYLLKIFLEKMLGEGSLENVVYFTVHLSEDGEEEHANETVRLAEKILCTENDFSRFKKGFYKACDDTKYFLDSIYDKWKDYIFLKLGESYDY